MKITKQSLAQIAFEFFSIVFAVMLALGLSTYKQSLDLQSEAESVRNNILEEFKSNLIKVDSILLKNEAYTQYLDSLVKLNPDDVRSFYFNYEFELLTQSAWDIAQNSSATGLVENEFLLQAADIYHSQKFLENFSFKLFENIGVALMRKDELNDANMALSMYYNVDVMNSTSQTLKESYIKFLKIYGEENVN